ncbi:hypothetical protein FRX31_021892, partial [Thalictrum thalictroides]
MYAVQKEYYDAKGSYFERNGDDDKIHSVDLGKDNVKVSIVLPLKPQTLLPIPIGNYITTVGKAVGTFVAWPKEFVISDERNEGIENNNEFDDYKTKKKSQMHRAIAKRLQDRQGDQVILLPYNNNGHWVLLVIDISGKQIYYMDSLGMVPSNSIKLMVNAGIKLAIGAEGKTWTPICRTVQ